MKDMKDVEIVKIYMAEDNLQADMILETLRNNHIPAMKQDADAGGFMNLYSGNAKCGEYIYVAECNAPKALEILQEMGL